MTTVPAHVLPAAVLWDLDGTLVDTEPYWIDAEYDLVGRYGAPWTHEDALQLVGNNLIDTGRYVVARTGIPLTPEQVVDDLLDQVVVHLRDAVPWRDGARELLDELRRAGVPQALVTMSYTRLVDPVLAALPAESFATVVTGDTVRQGKPHPEPYLAAARALGVAPATCVAIEDSVTGTTSAEAAGCRVLVVPNHVEVPPGPRRVFAPTLRGLDPESLAGLVHGLG